MMESLCVCVCVEILNFACPFHKYSVLLFALNFFFQFFQFFYYFDFFFVFIDENCYFGCCFGITSAYSSHVFFAIFLGE